jgi:hypothetical protein
MRIQRIFELECKVGTKTLEASGNIFISFYLACFQEDAITFSERVKSTLYRDHNDRCFGFLTTFMVRIIEDSQIQNGLKEQPLVCKSSKVAKRDT